MSNRIVLASLAALSVVASACAATYQQWISPGASEGNYGGYADDPDSWGGSTGSASETTYLFNSPGSYDIGLRGNFQLPRTIAVDNGADVSLKFAPYVWDIKPSTGGRCVRIPFSSGSDVESKLALESGTLTNIYCVYVGNKPNTPGGRLSIDGENSRMFVTDTFYVGYISTNSSATARITDGARLSTAKLVVGNGGVDRASLFVGGGAAVDVTTGNLTYVGGGSSSNTLCVTGAGTSVSIKGQLRAGTTPASISNMVIIADGAVWTNKDNNFIIGYQGAYNVGMITNGASCSLKQVYVGGAKESYGNMLLVSGQGTTVSASNVYSGMGGNGNLIRVDDGASVAVTTLNLNYGTDSQAQGSAPSCGNKVEIDGPGTYVGILNPSAFGYTNSEAKVTVSNEARLDIGSGDKYIYVGQCHGASSNSVEVVAGGVVTNQMKLCIGGASECRSNMVCVSGANSLWRQMKLVKVGGYGHENELRIEDGATWWQTGDSLYVGYYDSSVSNCVTVTGTGSLLNISNKVFLVGYAGKWNRLVVTDGGVCYVGGGGGSVVSNESSLVISNGRLSCEAPVNMYSSTLELAGVNGYAHIPQLNLKDGGCTIRFVADRNGLPLLYVIKSSSTEKNIKINAPSGGRIEIDATKCRVRGTFTLFDSANPMPESLRSNIVTTGPVSLEWSSDYKKLTATTTPNVGFVMLVR